MSLRDLAKESGISPGYLSLVLNGERGVPQPEVIERITRALKLKSPMLHLLAGFIPEGDPKWKEFFDRIKRMDDNEIDWLMEQVKNLPKKR